MCQTFSGSHFQTVNTCRLYKLNIFGCWTSIKVYQPKCTINQIHMWIFSQSSSQTGQCSCSDCVFWPECHLRLVPLQSLHSVSLSPQVRFQLRAKLVWDPASWPTHRPGNSKTKLLIFNSVKYFVVFLDSLSCFCSFPHDKKRTKSSIWISY